MNRFFEKLITIFILINTHNVKAAINNKEHRTHGASLTKNELSCYQCDTALQGDRCSNLANGNKSMLVHKCLGDKRMCMVTRFSYTTANENSTSMLRLWWLQRNCTAKCEPGCIFIGERTKLYWCISCCSKNLCNVGKAGTNSVHKLYKIIISITAVSLHLFNSLSS